MVSENVTYGVISTLAKAGNRHIMYLGRQGRTEPRSREREEATRDGY